MAWIDGSGSNFLGWCNIDFSIWWVCYFRGLGFVFGCGFGYLLLLVFGCFVCLYVFGWSLWFAWFGAFLGPRFVVSWLVLVFLVFLSCGLCDLGYGFGGLVY